jgi:hypothetical protein
MASAYYLRRECSKDGSGEMSLGYLATGVLLGHGSHPCGSHALTNIRGQFKRVGRRRF